MLNHPDYSGYSRRKAKGFRVTIHTGSLLLLSSVLWADPLVSPDPEPFPLLGVSKLESVVVKTSSYQDYKIDRALIRRKAILLVFPGSWDPYSIHVLKVLRNVDAELAAMDVQVIAVSADSPIQIKSLLDEHDIPFVVASDPQLQVATRLNMVETVDAARREKFKRIGAGEVEQVSTLNLLFFREDGEVDSHWHPTESELLISQEQVKKMAAHLHVLPSE